MQDQIERMPTVVGRPSIGDGIAADMLRTELRQIVWIHQVMLEKLLGDSGEVAPEVADLLEDAGTTYLQIAQRISAMSPASRPGC